MPRRRAPVSRRLPLRRPLADLDADECPLPAPEDIEHEIIAGSGGEDGADQAVGSPEERAVRANQHITGNEARRLRRAVIGHVHHEETEDRLPRERHLDRLCRYTEIRAGRSAPQELLYGVARHGEGEAARDHAVDADDATLRVREWPATVAGREADVRLHPRALPRP